MGLELSNNMSLELALRKLDGATELLHEVSNAINCIGIECDDCPFICTYGTHCRAVNPASDIVKLKAVLNDTFGESKRIKITTAELEKLVGGEFEIVD